MAKSPSKPVAVSYPSKIVKPSPGDVAEVYSALQGEGTEVGERQLFVRLGSCPFRCQYCDTPSALVPSEFCDVETPLGSRKFKKRKNPVPAEDLARMISDMLANDHAHRALTFTGGEPLWQAGYLADLLPRLKPLERRVYLETAGVHVSELRSILDHVDVIAMDIKPPSATGMKPMWSAHRDFLKTALVKQAIVKVVVTRKTTTTDLTQIRDMVAEVDRRIPVVIQPVTPAWKVRVAPTIDQLFSWQSLLSQRLTQVRVIPQCHRVMGDR